PKLEPWKHP
nr:Chain C, Protein Tat 9-mer peptide [synthetic construct]